MRVSVPGGEPLVADLLFDKTGTIDVKAEPKKQQRRLEAVLSALRKLRIRFYFVTDDRELLSNLDVPPTSGEHVLLSVDPDSVTEQIIVSGAGGDIFHTTGKPRPPRQHQVDIALDGALKRGSRLGSRRRFEGLASGRS